MADIQVVINLREGADGVLSSLASPDNISNASIQKENGETFESLSQRSDGRNLKSWGKLVEKDGEMVYGMSLADGYVGGQDSSLVEQYGYDGYVFGATSSSGELNVTLNIYGDDLFGVIIYGDKNANQFPTQAYLDDDDTNIIYNSDLVWTIRFDEPADFKTITFTNWNRGEYNACLTSVQKLSANLTFDKSSIKNLESLSQSTGQPNEIFYGVVSNSGSIEIIDINGEILDMADNDVFSVSNSSFDIFVNGKKVQKHIVSDSDYDLQKKVFSGGISNRLSKVQSNTYNNQYRILKNISLFNLLSRVTFIEDIDYATEKYVFRGENPAKIQTIKKYLSDINIPYVYFDNLTELQIVEKICKIAQLSFLLDDNGKHIFIDARPIIRYQPNSLLPPDTSDVYSNPIVIPYNRQFSVFDINPFTKQQYNSVDIDVNVGSFSVSNVLKKSFNVVDAEGNLTTNNIGNNAKFVTCTNGDIKVCIIDEVVSNENEFWDFYTSLYNDNVHPYSVTSYNNNPSGLTSLSNEGTGFTILDGLPEDYEFDNISRSDVKRFAFGRGFHRNILAIEGIVYESSSGVTFSNVEYNLILKNYTQQFETESFGDEQNLCTFSQNEYLQDLTVYENNRLSNLISNSVINDFSDGLLNGKITVACLDYYNTSGAKVKDFSNGEVIKVGDFVRIDKDNNGTTATANRDGTPKYWKVIGRNFRYKGVALLDLELKECIAPKSSIFVPDGLVVYSGNKRIYNGDKINIGDNFVVSGVEYEAGFESSILNWIKSNNEEVTLNTGIEVLGNNILTYSFIPVKSFDRADNVGLVNLVYGSDSTSVQWNENDYSLKNNTVTICIYSYRNNRTIKKSITLNGQEFVSGTAGDNILSLDYSINENTLTISNISSTLNGSICYLEGAYILPEIIR